MKSKAMSKLPHVGTTIFTVMSKLAQEHHAINLAQGFPDFPVDEVLVKKVREAAGQDFHQYMPMTGYPKLNISIASAVKDSYQRTIDPAEEILVTAGATQAIFTTIVALVDKGDEVIILDPAYDCYAPAVILAGGRPVHIPLDETFCVDWERVKDLVNGKTRMLIMNNPHNPSGRIWKEHDFQALEVIMAAYGQILLLADEVYEYITFEENHISVNTRPSIRERSIIASSFGKTFHITGWKLGYLVAAPEIMAEIRKVHQFNVFCVNSIAQASIVAYMADADLSSLRGFYKVKRDLFNSLMQESRFTLLPCEGTYFQLADYSAISSEPDTDFCKRITREHGVAAIPVSVFNADGRDEKKVRFCFAKKEETLINAAQKLCRI